MFCDRVAIMNHGEIVAIDRPQNLKNTIQSTSSIEVAFENTFSEEGFKFETLEKIVLGGVNLHIKTL